MTGEPPLVKATPPRRRWKGLHLIGLSAVAGFALCVEFAGREGRETGHMDVSLLSTRSQWKARIRGGPRDADKLREKVLQPAADRAGLGKISLAQLAAILRYSVGCSGARMKVAQELMRHSIITTTMDIYTGTAERDKRETAGRVATAVLGKIQ